MGECNLDDAEWYENLAELGNANQAFVDAVARLQESTHRRFGDTGARRKNVEHAQARAHIAYLEMHATCARQQAEIIRLRTTRPEPHTED